MGVFLKATTVYVGEIIFLNQYLPVAVVVYDYGQMQSLTI